MGPCYYGIPSGLGHIQGQLECPRFAIIDTGIDEAHPELASRIVAGYDFVENDTNPHDLNGHGTHVAGIAAAVTNNGAGVAGMDWQARIMPVRVLDASGSGYTSNVVSGINWAFANGADVLNLSLGSTSNDWYLQYAVTNAHAAGSSVVAAMGNNRNQNPTSYPAACENVMAVAATGPSDTYTYYSQYGSHCDIAAPGGDMAYLHDPDGIYSTMPTYHVVMNDEGYYQNYDYLQGTSMATPYVSGLAALVRSLDSTLSPDQVQTIIENTAVDLGSNGWDVNYGHGRIDAMAALLEALDPPAAPVLSSISNADGDGAYLVDWNDVPTAASYTLQEDDNSSFTSPTAVYIGAGTQLDVSGHTGGMWFYRVLASNQAGDGPWSNTQAAVVRPAAPVLDPITNPGGGDAYMVSWSTPVGAVAYRLEEDDNSAFTSPAVRYEGSAPQYGVTGQPEGSWYYRALAYNMAGDSPWSGTANTNVSPRPLAAPVIDPIGNPDGDGTYMVSWPNVPGATGYTLEQSSNPYFSSPEVVYTGSAPEFGVSDQPGGTWYYRARAIGAAGSGPWSNTRSAIVTSDLYLPLGLWAYDPDVLIDEGFEGGAIPPDDWTLVATDPVYTWEIWPFTPPFPPPTYPGAYEGSYSAACNGTGMDQDEVLLSPPFQATTASLRFYSFGDPSFWNDSRLRVWLVIGDWDGGASDDILVHTANNDWPTDPLYYLWVPSSVDLTPDLPAGTPVRVGFQYTAGPDGDLIGLDAILITRY